MLPETALEGWARAKSGVSFCEATQPGPEFACRNWLSFAVREYINIENIPFHRPGLAPECELRFIPRRLGTCSFLEAIASQGALRVYNIFSRSQRTQTHATTPHQHASSTTVNMSLRVWLTAFYLLLLYPHFFETTNYTYSDMGRPSKRAVHLQRARHELFQVRMSYDANKGPAVLSGIRMLQAKAQSSMWNKHM